MIAANNLQLQFFVKENSEETLNFGRAENAREMKLEQPKSNNAINGILRARRDTVSVRESGSAMPLCGIVLPLSKRPREYTNMLFSLSLAHIRLYVPLIVTLK